MKTKIGRRAKSALAILLTLCMAFSVFTVGVVSVGAATADSESVGAWSFSGTSYMYFDNTTTKWNDSSIMLFIGKDGYTSVYPMSKVSNTNLYVVKLPSSGWTDATYMAVVGAGSSWNSGDWGPSNRTNATHYTNTYISGLSASDKQRYVFTPSSSNNNCNISLTYLGSDNAGMKREQKAIARYTTNDSTYTTGGTGGNVNVKGYKFSAYNTVASANGTAAASVTNSDIGYGTTVTYVATPASNYAFVGWFTDLTGGTAVSTATSYSFKVTEATTLYARFRLATTPLPKPTWSSSTVATNAGTAATLTLSNHSTISGQDSGVTYVLKKGSATLTSGTDYTFNNDTGVFTLKNTTTAAAGSYTVQAIAANTNTYSNSAVSEPATVTVYEPLYSLSLSKSATLSLRLPRLQALPAIGTPGRISWLSAIPPLHPVSIR